MPLNLRNLEDCSLPTPIAESNWFLCFQPPGYGGFPNSDALSTQQSGKYFQKAKLWPLEAFFQIDHRKSFAGIPDCLLYKVVFNSFSNPATLFENLKPGGYGEQVSSYKVKRSRKAYILTVPPSIIWRWSEETSALGFVAFSGNLCWKMIVTWLELFEGKWPRSELFYIHTPSQDIPDLCEVLNVYNCQSSMRLI